MLDQMNDKINEVIEIVKAVLYLKPLGISSCLFSFLLKTHVFCICFP